MMIFLAVVCATASHSHSQSQSNGTAHPPKHSSPTLLLGLPNVYGQPLVYILAGGVGVVVLVILGICYRKRRKQHANTSQPWPRQQQAGPTQYGQTVQTVTLQKQPSSAPPANQPLLLSQPSAMSWADQVQQWGGSSSVGSGGAHPAAVPLHALDTYKY